MIDKSGIFSLIDEKNFRYENLDSEDPYTYKIEKIFNYQNCLFVLFSKLYLKMKEGDSVHRNHLYLFTIEKKDRSIIAPEYGDFESELYKMVENFENQLVDLYEGKYKNISFIDDKIFNITITEMTGDPSEANVWARVYRKLRGNEEIVFKKVNNNINSTNYIENTKFEINNDNNDIDQFITLYFERSTKQALVSYGGAQFGRIGLNDITNGNKVTPEERKELESIKDEYRKLYNYEYYWDYKYIYEDYARNCFFFNNFLYSRDFNDTTENGETNERKLFPYFETTYVGGGHFISDGSTSDPYLYKDRSFINDCLLSINLDDNYIKLAEKSYNKINNEAIYNYLYNSIEKSIYYYNISDKPKNVSINDGSMSNTLYFQYINVTPDLSEIMNIKSKKYLQRYFKANDDIKLDFCKITSVLDGENIKYSLVRTKIIYDSSLFDWRTSNISEVEITDEKGINLIRTSLSSRYRIATFTDEFNQFFKKYIVIIPKLNEINDEVMAAIEEGAKLNIENHEFMLCYMDNTHEDIGFYLVKPFIKNEEATENKWSEGTNTILAILPKAHPCNMLLNLTNNIPKIDSNNQIKRSTDKCIYNEQDETGIWNPIDSSNIKSNEYFLKNNPQIKKLDKIYINNTSICDGKAYKGINNKFYINCNLYDVNKEIDYIVENVEGYENLNENTVLLYDKLDNLFGRNKEYYNNDLPNYIGKNSYDTIFDGRKISAKVNAIDNMITHYKVNSNDKNYKKFLDILKDFNMFKNVTQKYLYIVTDCINYFKYTDYASRMIFPIEDGKYYVLDRINIDNIKKFIDKENGKIIEEFSTEVFEYLYSMLEEILFYYSDYNIKFIFSDELINGNLDGYNGAMNALGIHNGNYIFPFEGINAVYIPSLDVMEGKDTNNEIINGDNISLRTKYVAITEVPSDINFVSNKNFKDSDDNKCEPNKIYRQQFSFLCSDDECKNPIINKDNYQISSAPVNMSKDDYMGIKTIYDFNDITTSKAILLKNVNGEIKDRGNKIPTTILLNDEIPIYVFTNNNKYNKDTDDNEFVLNSLTYHDLTNDEIDIIKKGKEYLKIERFPVLLADFVAKNGAEIIDTYKDSNKIERKGIMRYLFLVDFSNTCNAYLLRWQKADSDHKCWFSISEVYCDNVTSIVSKNYGGKVNFNFNLNVNINDANDIGNYTLEKPDEQANLGIKITISDLFGDPVKFMILLSKNEEDKKLLTSYISNQFIGFFRISNDMPYLSEGDTFTELTNASTKPVKAYFFNETKFLSYLKLDYLDSKEYNDYTVNDEGLNKLEIRYPKNDIVNDGYIYADYIDKSQIENNSNYMIITPKRFIEDFILNSEDYTYKTYIDPFGHKSLSYEIDKSKNYDLDKNRYIEDNYFDHFFGSSSTDGIYYIATRYGKVYSNFNLTLSGDKNWDNFFTIKEYGYIPYSKFDCIKYVLLESEKDEGNDNGELKRQISVLKNNGIVDFDIDGYLKKIDSNGFLTETSDLVVNNYFLTDITEQQIPTTYSTFEGKLYDNNKKINLDDKTPGSKIYEISFDINENNLVNVTAYLTNKETDLNSKYIDILNLLDNKVPFYKLDYEYIATPNEEAINIPTYKYYAYSVNNKIVIVRNVNLENNYGCTELLAVLNFPDDMILCGNKECILAIRNYWDYDSTKKFNYSTPFVKLTYDDIMKYLFDSLDKYLPIDKTFTITTDIPFTSDVLVFKDTNIEETSIIDSDKSDYYDIENQTVITKNLMEINYAKLYNVYESNKGNKNIGYRLFVCMNGRILVSNDLFDFDNIFVTEKTETNSDNTTEIQTDEEMDNINKYKRIELVDFYTINGRVNEIYIESIDIDNNNLMCVASDRDELYIFENLFKSNSIYFKSKMVNYIFDKLAKNCLKYIYNFNNEILDKDTITPEKNDNRSEYYRQTLTPTILHIGSSIDDISICDRYLNTLNTKLMNFKYGETKDEEKIELVNSIKYFKLSDDLSLNTDNFNIEGDNQDENNNFDDSGNYIKIESYRPDNNTELFETNTRENVLLNLRLNINNQNIDEAERYYIFGYNLKCYNIQEGTIINENKNICYNDDKKYNLTMNNVLFEENNIYKNIYIAIPKDALSFIMPPNNSSENYSIQEIQEIISNINNHKIGILRFDSLIQNSNDVSEIIKENIKNKFLHLIDNNGKYIEDEDIYYKYHYVYSLPLKLEYSVTDSAFKNETFNSSLDNLPKKLTTRDHFVATIENEGQEINRLYFRWRYIGNRPKFSNENENNYDYYLLSFTSNKYYNIFKHDIQNITYDISMMLKNYLINTFNSNYNDGDFVISKINFDEDTGLGDYSYKWAHLNLPLNTKKCELYNVIIKKKKDSDNVNWFDDILFEGRDSNSSSGSNLNYPSDFNYRTIINLDTIKRVYIPYEKVKITYDEYNSFLEYMENALVQSKKNVINENYEYNIEWAYQPSCAWSQSKNINLIATKNIFINDFEKDKETLMKNVFNKMIFVSDHDFYFQDDRGYNCTLIKAFKLDSKNPYKYNTANYFNPDVRTKYNDLSGEDYANNIYRDFIKWKYNYETYKEYEDFLWSLILEEEDILNFKLNSNDGSFSIKNTKDKYKWWLKNEDLEDNNRHWWEIPAYRNMWIHENYMPLKNTLYDNIVKVYTDESFNNGFTHNVAYDTTGMLYLTEDLSDIIHYGIEKRLITGVYIDGLKLFNEGYYYKDLLNDTQDIYINPSNLRSYFVDTKKFPFYSTLLNMLYDAVKPINDYKEALRNYIAYETDPTDYMKKHDTIPTKPDLIGSAEIDLKKILSNIEVNTNFGLVSEQEKLIATIEVKRLDSENFKEGVYTNITRTVLALNDEGAYYINDYDTDSPDNDLVIDNSSIGGSLDNVFTNQLTLNFNDSYITDIVNNNDRINVYISYKNDVGGKYARRINPKFVKVTIDGQNVKLEIKGFYNYETLSTIYLVTGDINNHNMFFKNIDESIEYVDLAEVGTLNNGRLFKWLSYDNIVSATDIEINMNGYILYPNIDYTVMNSSYTNSDTNVIIFRNTLPSNGNVSMELNLRPDNNSKIIYKTKQAFSMTKENYNNGISDTFKKIPIAKTITMDNDRYQFLSSTVESLTKEKITTNKFDVYINNMKVPNKFINIINSKTITISNDNNDYAIDLHKTHMAKLVDKGRYEITTEYNINNNEDYRFFDPEYKNIMIIFQNKFNPYNYEIEINNKYSKNNFISLLKNLFFTFKDDDNYTDSCYVPANETNIYDNFDWICDTSGGILHNNSSNTKLDLLENEEYNIINCNYDNLNVNISLDAEPIENNVLKDNILFDCNPSDY